MQANTEAMPLLQPGIYEHYKGNRYRVLGVAKHSETHEELVVYEALYKHDLSSLWVRPLSMFMESVEIEGQARPRFVFIGGSDFLPKKDYLV